MNILVLNGPNLNLLGTREPDNYGKGTLIGLQEELSRVFSEVQFSFFQSNHEGDLIDRLHHAEGKKIQGIVFNPGGFTHTSVSIRDAIASINIPVVEVHITNIASRETFRHVSITSSSTVGQISGFGLNGYHLAVQFFIDKNNAGQ